MFWDVQETTVKFGGTEVPLPLVFLFTSYCLLPLIHHIKFIQNFFNEQGPVVNEDIKRNNDILKKQLIIFILILILILMIIGIVGFITF